MRLPFSFALPAVLGTAAAERGLGPRVAAYRRRRPLRAWVVLVIAVADLTASLIISLAAGDYDVGIALLAAFPARSSRSTSTALSTPGAGSLALAPRAGPRSPPCGRGPGP
jgi:hypothetical protein